MRTEHGVVPHYATPTKLSPLINRVHYHWASFVFGWFEKEKTPSSLDLASIFLVLCFLQIPPNVVVIVYIFTVLAFCHWTSEFCNFSFHNCSKVIFYLSQEMVFNVRIGWFEYRVQTCASFHAQLKSIVSYHIFFPYQQW